jgi:hypothetical protein
MLLKILVYRIEIIRFMIPKYLGRIETFSSMSLDLPYIFVVNIDRNKIRPRIKGNYECIGSD